MTSLSGHILVKRKSIGKPGDPGLPGLIHRTSEWASGIEYRNDSAMTSDIRYLDIAVVTTGANTFRAFRCKKTHTSSSSITYTNTTYWEEMNSMYPIYTPLIMAMNAIFRFTQTNKLYVMKDDGVTVNLGMGGGDYPLWIGAPTPELALLRVLMDGSVEAENAKIRGKFIAGDPNGQRIEILPDTKEIKGYDDQGKNVINISGNDYDPDTYIPSEVLKLLSNTPNQTSYKAYNSGETAVMGTFTVTEGMRAKIIVNTLRAYTSNTQISGSITIALQKMAGAGSSIVEETLQSITNTAVVGSANATSKSTKIFAQLEPGYYRLVRIISVNGTCNFSWFVTAYTMDSLLKTNIFRNGVSVVQNRDNLFQVITDGTGNIQHNVKIGGAPQPITVFDAYISDTESTTGINSVTKITPSKTFIKPSETLVVRKLTNVGEYEFLIPMGLGWDCDTSYSFRARMTGNCRGVMGAMFCSNYNDRYWSGFTVTRYNSAGQAAYGPFDIEILAYN